MSIAVSRASSAGGREQVRMGTPSVERQVRHTWTHACDRRRRVRSRSGGSLRSPSYVPTAARTWPSFFRALARPSCATLSGRLGRRCHDRATATVGRRRSTHGAPAGTVMRRHSLARSGLSAGPGGVADEARNERNGPIWHRDPRPPRRAADPAHRSKADHRPDARLSGPVQAWVACSSTSMDLEVGVPASAATLCSGTNGFVSG